MKDLDKIIQENRADFDVFEPSDNHLKRFEHKLSNFNEKQKTFSFGYFMKVASIVVLIVLSGLWVYDNFESKITNNGIALRDVSPEYSEVELYYTHLVNQKYNEINQFQFMDSEQKLMLVQELNEMDSIYENLKKDLTTNPHDERVISAMIKHYQLKVEVMNQILQQLQTVQNINQQKSENNESTNI